MTTQVDISDTRKSLKYSYEALYFENLRVKAVRYRNIKHDDWEALFLYSYSLVFK